jgi:DNA-binding FadR family transcriptional regulator
MSNTLRRETLPEQLAEQLVNLIEQQRLIPGDFLPSAAAVAEQYGVSRPVVREALRTLEARGIVRIENGRGAIVQPFTNDQLSQFFQRAVNVRRESLVELLEVRKGLEVESASLAAIRATDDELRRIDQQVRKMGAAVGEGTTYAELDAQLHLQIASAAHNTMLLYLIESIREPLKVSIEEGLRSRAKAAHHSRVQELHEELACALGNRDAAGAAEIMSLHFDEAVLHIAGIATGEDPSRQSTERQSLASVVSAR